METVCIPSELSAIAPTRVRFFQFLKDNGAVHLETLRAWDHIFAESVTNAIVHGNQNDRTKPVCVGWRVSNDHSIELHVSDTGTGIHPAEAKLPAPTAESGRGLYIIHALCDTYEHTYPSSGEYRQVLTLRISPTNLSNQKTS